MKNIYDTLKGPCLTEKASLIQEKVGQVIVKVHPDANKIDIKNAVEKMFNVKVSNVRTAKFLGKHKRVGRHPGQQSDWKKAYITLSEGSIVFADEL